MKATAPTSNAAIARKDVTETDVMEPAAWLEAGGAARNQRETCAVHLTPRQLQVLALLCEGLPNKLICRKLNIATGTVKVHIGCILRELGVSSRLQAVVAARRSGLLGQAVSRTPEHATNPAVTGQSAIAAGPSEFGTPYRPAAAF
ncbi:MAG TPA: LuxR C-terminal-related transcriptional regulator [Burkholderiales bacterium]|nr:LuxR C-terminal-related transcriptional regulator [Burkholderiales bacterium]